MCCTSMSSASCTSAYAAFTCIGVVRAFLRVAIVCPSASFLGLCLAARPRLASLPRCSTVARIHKNVLQYVLLIFLAYIVTAFLARPNWGDVLAHTLIPHLSFTPAYVAGALALIGTTLTSYAYVWETIEEGAEHPPLRRLGLVQVDAGLGMVIAGVIFWFIVIGTGATLGVHHKTVQTAQDAASALTPLAGHFASIIFGVGLLASAILALPVLAGTSAYVMAEAFGWRRSLDARFHRRRASTSRWSSVWRSGWRSPSWASAQSNCSSSARLRAGWGRPSRWC
ncbi:MAG TPA: divalent metal cation transporter [Ktedonobacterales bacterium]|nr:divalent metal cation transporter [Ktedonobacterales bacterium]